ncbi:MlaD family protein [Williamwhitmania taraxaci]|nr:MlaD family protein [Williamwhitmania taraxaci]
MKIAKEIKIGLFAVVMIGALVWGLNFLKGRQLFQSARVYYGVYQRIDGLQETAPVFLNGYRVGTVEKISLRDQQPTSLLVQFSLDKEVNLPVETIAQIYSSDLMGSKAIRLVPSLLPNILHPGDTLITSIEGDLKEQVSLQVLPLKKKAEDLMADMQEAIEMIKLIFNEKSRKNLEMSISNIKLTMDNLESATGTIDTILRNQQGKVERIIINAESISSNLKNKNAQLSNIINNFSAISDTLAKTSFSSTITETNNALRSFNGVISKISNGEGSLGLLIKNDSLYNNLDSAAKHLDLLLKDINKNPKRYVNFSVFGKKDSK